MFYVQDIIPLLVFLGVIAGIFAALNLISNRNSRALERLQRMGRPRYELDPDALARAKNERFQGIVETAKALSQPLMPQTELEQSALRRALLYLQVPYLAEELGASRHDDVCASPP